MNRVVAIAMALLALGLLMWLAVMRTGPAVEADLGSRVAAQLLAQDLSQIAVTADGQEIYLRGSVVSERLRDRAMDIAASERGVSAVHDQLQVVVPLSVVANAGDDATSSVPQEQDLKPNPSTPVAPWLEMELADGIVVRGMVADASTRDALLSDIDNLFGARDISAALNIDDRVGLEANTGLLDALRFALPGVSALASGRLLIRGGQIQLQGEAASFADKARMLAANTALAPSGFQLQISVDAPAATEDGCQGLFDELLQEKIEFATNSADIDPVSLPLLRRLVSVLDTCGFAIEVGGHTDSTGDEVYNQWLSERRAEAVSAFLIANSQGLNAGLTADPDVVPVGSAMVRAVGYGESQPIQTNQSRPGRAANRRIEFKVRRISP